MRLLRLPNKDMAAAGLFVFETLLLVQHSHFLGNTGAL